MKHVSILVPRGVYVLSSIVGTYKVFCTANAWLEAAGRPAQYSLSLVGLDASSAMYDGLFSINPDTLLADARDTDLIIIPAIQPPSTGINAAFIPWITSQYAGGAEVASLCVGAFLLATTGLLDGKTAATHWKSAAAFRNSFPQVALLDDKVITDEQGIYTSGGAYSFLNLVLYIVEKYSGREVAIYVSKVLQIDIERDSQSPFTIFSGQKEHEDMPIKMAQNYMETNVGERMTVEELASRFAISRRNFERRFKKATTNTPVEYMQRVKMEAAKRSLEAGSDKINEVMYAVGYTDSKAFRTIFKKVTGMSPLDYRRKYSRETAMSIG